MELSSLPSDPNIRKLLLLRALTQVRAQNKLNSYRPHPKQLEAHALGKTNRAVGVFGGNRTGKSVLSAAETTYHLTGEYPDWWCGRRFERATDCVVGSETYESTRDGAQTLLLGKPEQWGTGTIPKRCIVKVAKRSGGVKDVVDYARIKHKSGKLSTLKFKAYDQTFKKWMGVSFDFGWLDEEPPKDIYNEAKMRVFDKKGYLLLAFTPLSGMTDVCRLFRGSELPDSMAYVNMSWDDNPYLDPVERDIMISQMLPHELEARQKGIPIAGKGLIYQFEDSFLETNPFEIPAHWPRACGLDFGWAGGTAAAWHARDLQNDIIYCYNVYKRSRVEDPAQHASAFKALGNVPYIGDPAGGSAGIKDGESMFEVYAKEGIRIAKADNTHGAGLLAMSGRMSSGRYKVFSSCAMWFLEKSAYQYGDDGKIARGQDDHILDACRYAVMHTDLWRPPQTQQFNRPRAVRANTDGRHGGS